MFSQASAGVPGVPETRDGFGNALTSADLDGDGFADLLVEALREHRRYRGAGHDGSRTVLDAHTLGTADDDDGLADLPH